MTTQITAKTFADDELKAPPKPLQYISLSNIELLEGFWQDRFNTNATVTIQANFTQSEKTGRLSNFTKAAQKKLGTHEGFFFNDSDVYKIIEAAAYSLTLKPDPELDTYVENLIASIAAAQEDDGYLNTYYTLEEPENKWTNIAVRHELYCAGHLFEAAAAHYRATGRRSFLDVAIKLADHIDDRFGPGKNMYPPGHEEIEVGLIRLAEATGDQRYFKLSRFFIEQRGNEDGHPLYGAYAQDELPAAQQSEAVGHAVRAVYLYMAMSDFYEATGDTQYLDAVDRIWQNVVEKKLYVTGGVGASRAGEAFAGAYELENKSAYAETCGAIANALWNARLFRLHQDGKYIDVLERVVYNAVLAGVSRAGDHFFYPCPLESDGRTPFNHGSAERTPWFACACCPPNIARVIPQIIQYTYAIDTTGNEIYINFYAASITTLGPENAQIQITQNTDYPLNGNIKFTLKNTNQTPYAGNLNIRIPGWTQNNPVPGDLYTYLDDQNAQAVKLNRNGKSIPLKINNGYVQLSGPFSNGEKIELNLPMPIRRVIAHENVAADRNRMAIERGPMVYCIEGHDLDGAGPVQTLFMTDDQKLTVNYQPDSFGGLMIISGQAQQLARSENGDITTNQINFKATPFFAWNNRGVTTMQVWLPRTADAIPVPPPPTIASRSTATASHCFAYDTVEALNDQVDPKHSNDDAAPRQTWWPKRGTTEWVQYDFTEPTTVSKTSIYWFDDTGGGNCRIPKTWRVLYLDQNQNWQSVEAQNEYLVTKDEFNTQSFNPIKTTALRIEADLQDEFSAGVIEWKVE